MAKSKDTLKTRRERLTGHDLHSHRAHSIASIASADNKFPCCIELIAIVCGSCCKTLLLSVFRFIHFLCHAFAGFPFQIVKRYTILFMVVRALLTLTTELAFTLLTMAKPHCLLSVLFIHLLSLHNRLVCLHVQSSSTSTTITQPLSLFPYYNLQTDCNLNTLLGFDRYSKPHHCI